jgi:hypothetical protein
VNRSAILTALLATQLAALLAAPGARAEDRPATMPTRDVDVTYLMLQQDAPGGPQMLEQRMRWAVADGRLRVDPPTPGLWIVIDYHARRLTTVRDKERSAVQMDADTARILPNPDVQGGSATPFTARGQDNVAGLACTNWETRDAAGTPTLACITEDGVLLRAVAAGQILLEAATVNYGTLNKAVFEVPAGYQLLTAPPIRKK